MAMTPIIEEPPSCHAVQTKATMSRTLVETAWEEEDPHSLHTMLLESREREILTGVCGFVGLWTIVVSPQRFSDVL